MSESNAQNDVAIMCYASSQVIKLWLPIAHSPPKAPRPPKLMSYWFSRATHDLPALISTPHFEILVAPLEDSL